MAKFGAPLHDVSAIDFPSEAVFSKLRIIPDASTSAPTSAASSSRYAKKAIDDD
jgi:hypothetical protein